MLLTKRDNVHLFILYLIYELSLFLNITLISIEFIVFELETKKIVLRNLTIRKQLI